MTKLSKQFEEKFNHFSFFNKHLLSIQPNVAISACLNGSTVRYDAKNKTLLTRSLLSQSLNLLEQCPEVSAGMSIPRPPVQLVQRNNEIRAIGRDNLQLDVTNQLYQQRAISLLKMTSSSICGYIFKSRSPSCGIGSTPIFNQQGQQLTTGHGLHAAFFLEKMPWIIFRDEHQLKTKRDCDRFIFLTYLVSDLLLSINNKQLIEFNHHYHSIFKSEILQKSFLHNIQNNNIDEYKIKFKEEIEKQVG